MEPVSGGTFAPATDSAIAGCQLFAATAFAGMAHTLFATQAEDRLLEPESKARVGSLIAALAGAWGDFIAFAPATVNFLSLTGNETRWLRLRPCASLGHPSAAGDVWHLSWCIIVKRAAASGSDFASHLI